MQKKTLHGIWMVFFVTKCLLKTKTDRGWSNQFHALLDKNMYQSNFKYFTVIFTFFKS